MNPALKFRFLLFGFCIAVAAKFGLIWEMEIVDAHDDPHEYVLQVLHPANGGLSYPPGTGLVGQFFLTLGVPYRFGIEIAYLLALTLILKALLTAPWRSGLCLGLFVLLAFDPAVVELFNHFYSDPVWMTETLLGLALFALAFVRDPGSVSWSRLLPGIGFLCLSLLTRSVAVPLLSSAIVFALTGLVLLLAKYRSRALRLSLHLHALTVPTLIFSICLVYGLACYFGKVHHGYTGLSYIDSAEYKRFYLALQSVGEPDGPRYFPIDEKRRKLIAQAGPDSRWFIDQLESNGVYKQAGLDNYGVYDIPTGWFHWATFSATMKNGDYMASFELFRSIEDEIDSAGKLGHLPVRQISTAPDSRLPIVAAAFPRGVANCIARTVAEPAPALFSGERTYTDPDFTRALTRRHVTPSPWRESFWQSLTRLYAWLYTPVTFAAWLLALLGLLFAIVRRWQSLPEFPLLFLGRQYVTLLFIVYFLWYALFDASGMPATTRYMILHHVLLFPLIAYYLVTARQVWREGRL